MARTREDIGLLLVHGMGEQKPLDHLRSSAREMASFIATSPGLIRLHVRDDLDESESVTIDAVFKCKGGVEEQIRFHLHEVFWADLGIRGGLLEQARFWLWGLGQWAAGVVRTGNPRRNTSQLMDNPRFPFQKRSQDSPGFWRRLPSRLYLSLAGVIAFLTFFSWSAAKRVVSFLSRTLPEPSLIFLFLGDVKIYEEAGGPGKGSLLDPEHPMRTTIRRRMVSAMIGMAARPTCQRWYIFAHSLGTIPAFNAIQETELALPNYLSKEEWDAVPAWLRTSTPFTPAGRQGRTDKMMPRRPPWLAPTDGIDRHALFRRFAGFVTYGSPLDKFAALWPRVVPLNLQTAVFPAGCEWVNLYDPTDPIAAWLHAFDKPLNPADSVLPGKALLEPKSFPARASLLFGLSHIRYFTPRYRRRRATMRKWAVRLRRALRKLIRTLRMERRIRLSPRQNVMPAALVESIVSGGRTTLIEAAKGARMGPIEAELRRALALAQLALLGLSLAAASGLLLFAIGRALPDWATRPLVAAIDWISSDLLATLQSGGTRAVMACAVMMLAIAMLTVFVSGLIRIVTDRIQRARLRIHRRPAGATSPPPNARRADRG